MGFFHGKFRLLSLGKASCDSRTTQPTVHAGCFSVSKIHKTLTLSTGALMRTQMLMHAITHRGVQTNLRESALKVDSGRKTLAAPGNRTYISRVIVRCSNQLSYIHTHHIF